MVASTPDPSGPGGSPKLAALKVIVPATLSMAGPTGTVLRPVLPRKSPNSAASACTTPGEKARVNSKLPKSVTSAMATSAVKSPPLS